MKPIFILFLLAALAPLYAQNKCGVDEHKMSGNTFWQALQVEQETMIENWIKTNQKRVGQRAVVTIPVVVHIIWNTNAQNISDEQIFSQIEILNKDFRALNAEIATIPAVFQPLIADVEFEFCLAAVDPDGNPTTGITRKFTNNLVGIGGTTAIHYSAQGGQDAWDTERYLNIWVAKFAGGIGGISSFPGEGLLSEDGVQINYLQFGDINVSPPYHLGRTLTHEIGHYFNLEHPWGPSITDCCEDDFVDDTPESCETYISECPTHPAVSCSMPDVFMDYMFYTNDDCMGMFTKGQKERMWAALNLFRPGLLDNQVCEWVPAKEQESLSFFEIINNPADGQLFYNIGLGNSSAGKISLVTVHGQVIYENNSLQLGMNSIFTNQFPSGVYLVVFENETGSQVEKVVLL